MEKLYFYCDSMEKIMQEWVDGGRKNSNVARANLDAVKRTAFNDKELNQWAYAILSKLYTAYTLTTFNEGD